MSGSHQLRTVHLMPAARKFIRAVLLSPCLLVIASGSLSAQNASTCSSSDWFAVQQIERGGRSLSPLCKGELDAAEDHRTAAEAELNALIAKSPQSADAYAAHSTLAHFYLRLGHFHSAESQMLAMLALKPTASDLQNTQSLFELLGRYPDLTISSSHPATIRSHTNDGNIFAPVTVNGSDGTYMLDTGINLSIMSESEAARLGLKPQSSITRLSDISGTKSAELQVVDVDDLIVGGTHLRHVPFLVMADTNGAFTGLPPGHRGILGIQPLLALGTLTFRPDDTLEIDGNAEPGATTAPLLFDGAMPLTQIKYRGKPLTVTFDCGATQTTLNPPFATLYSQLIRSGTQQNHDMNGLAGTTARSSVSLPHLPLTFGRKVDLAPAIILIDQTTGTSSWAAANFGYDLMQQARPFTIDFHHMLITFPTEH